MELLHSHSTVKLAYTIQKYSSFSSKFAPENILVDNPQDQTSRWSSDSHVPPQFLVMKLESPAIVTSITFGKYEKSHVCNVKKLQVWGGLTEDHMMLLFDGGLKNDPHPETFSLKHTVADMPFPVRYIKLLPLQAWGSTFNFSIWHVALSGCPDPALVRRCIHTYTLHCEREALRVCLKHLRHNRYIEAFTALSREANTRLEHPVLTRLYQACTEHDGTELVENLISRALQSGLFNEYLSGQPLAPVWRQLIPPPGAAPNTSPGMRGGHQLCCDTQTQSIYLFGGWDGQEDLSDLWCYNIPANEWSCISPDTRIQGGPSPRSCHKLCLDSERRQLFTLGRYVDSKMRTADNLKSDFYLYELDSGRWTLITEDTAEVGGPRLVFDHQMVMDAEKRVIYVFGGRVLTQSRWEGVSLENERSVSSNGGFSPAELQFSGLYRYDVATNTWTCLREDDPAPARSSTGTFTGRVSDISRDAPASPSVSAAVAASSSSRSLNSSNISSPSTSSSSSSSGSSSLRSRVGHSMLFHPITRQLFILAGQRNKEYLTDFFTYQVDTDVITCINEKNSPRGCASISAVRPPGVASSAQGLNILEGGALLGASFPPRHSDVPPAGFTQKATIDPVLEEIHVLSGLSKEKDKQDTVCNSFWVYSIPHNKWSCIYHNELSGDGPDNRDEPCPRFAHQLVYDHVNKIHYMFGGNPGRHQQPKMRLDDFWSLQLSRPSPEKLLQEIVFIIRKSWYEELAVRDSSEALRYLQTELHEAVDHNNPEQVTELQRLACTLFQPPDPEICQPPPLTSLPQPPPQNLPLFSDLLSPQLPPNLDLLNSDARASASSSPLLMDMSGSNSLTMQDNSLMLPENSLTLPEISMPGSPSSTEQLIAWRHRHRSELFNVLTKYFPENMTQPKTNLVDLVTL
ncbi:muskelin [Hyalella azteca]|uniref:Muskelin n=1 Tax=Hyalella azteca TaxID=294128 RepID=A0A8B7P072_HYAAZ|nr:muskelin [Hyalella azteca]